MVYYVSNIGSDSYNGTSQTFTGGSNGPWATCAKVNSSSFVAGDQILFRKGDTFIGPLNPPSSGSSSAAIFISSYGSGAKPIITGFTSLNSWSSSGSNLYTHSLSAGSRLNILTVGSTQKWMGRTQGWATISSYSAIDGSDEYHPIVTITGNLPSSPNFNGGEVVVKVREWMINPGLITSHSGSNITYISPNQFRPEQQSGFGYFIQNHPSTLNTQDEWYYNGSNTLTMYSTSTPSGVRAASINNLISIDSKNYITIDSLQLNGANVSCVNLSGCNDVRIQNCDISLAGLDGIHATFSTVSVNSNNIFNCNNEAVRLESCSNSIVAFNTVDNIAMIIGAGRDNNGAMNGMRIDGTNNLVEYNRISNVGYCGINISGQGFICRKNFITYYCMVVTDGGGIYVSDEPTTNKVIEDNICLHGYGNAEATPYGNSFACFGIYLDEATAHVTVNRNTMAFNGEGAQGGGGLYLHKAHDINITNNIFFNNIRTQLRLAQDLPEVKNSVVQPIQYIRNVVFTNNVVFSTATGNYLYNLYSNPSPDLDFDKFFSSLNNNILAKPAGDANLVHTFVWNTNVQTDYTLAQWKAFKNTYDQASTAAPTAFNTVTPRFEYNDTMSTKVVSLDGTYMDTSGSSYAGSVSLPAFSSKILAKTSDQTGFTPLLVVGIRINLV